MTKSVRATFIVLSATLALAACGGDDEPSARKTQATVAPAPQADPARDNPAREALLVLSDLPAGWTAPDEDDQRASDCSAVRQARNAAKAVDSSPRFQRRPTSQVSHTVYLYSGEKRAKRAYRGLVAPGTRECIGSRLTDRLGDAAADVKVGDMETVELAIDPVGAQSGAARVSLDYATPSGTGLTLGADLVVVREGRGLALLTLFDEKNELDEQLRARLTTVAGRKLRDALSGSSAGP